MFLAQLDTVSIFAVISFFLAIVILVGLLFRFRASASEPIQRPFINWIDVSATSQKIFGSSMLVMLLLVLAVGGVAVVLLYNTSLKQQKARLIEMTTAQARLIEAVARYDRNLGAGIPEDAADATVAQVIDAHQQESELGETGEFTLARLEDNQIVYLLKRRHLDEEDSQRIPFSGSVKGEPMRRALSGKSGTMVTTDYRGERVLAAYEPIDELGMGIVAKIDFDEIRGPLIRASIVGLGAAAWLILIGGLGLLRVNKPLVEQLEQQERTLEAIVTNAADGIFTVDHKGTLLSFNQKAESIFGYPASEVLGTKISQLIQGQTDKHIEASLTHLKGELREEVGRRKDGDLFAMEVAVNPMTQTTTATYVGIARDITERKRMEGELRQANFLSDIALDLTGCGYWHIDYADPGCYFQSPRAAQILGEPLKPDMRYDLQDEWFTRLLEADPEAAAATQKQYQGAIEGKHEKYESIYPYKRPVDGKIVWLHALGKVVRGETGEIQFMYGAYQDITKQRQAEMMMQEAQQQAETASEKALAASRAKSDFLSHMSHELRTPLNGILGYAQILERDRKLTSSQRRHVNAVVNCGQHLLALINDVLDLSKIEAGRLEVDAKPTDLHELLESVGEIVRPRANSKGIDFQIEISSDVPRFLMVDAAKLRQILINLAGNAVKFTQQGSVKIQVAQNSPSRFTCHVVDTGVGMSEPEMGVIFDAFKQVEAGKDAGGTGLGLAISKRLSEAMGGGISVESVPGQGSTFSMDLPLLPVDEGQVELIVARTESQNNRMILAPGCHATMLVVDDHATNRDILQGLLQQAGFQVVLASGGREALKMLGKDPQKVDLVLMDIQMPGMNGNEAVQKIRADRRLQDVKVIAVTASVFPEFREQAIAAGFNDFLGKPFHVNELMKMLQTHLGLDFVFEDLESQQAKLEDREFSTAEQGGTAILSSDRITELTEALQIKNMTALKNLASELMEDLETRQLGEKIAGFVSDFNFKQLNQLAKQLEKPSE